MAEATAGKLNAGSLLNYRQEQLLGPGECGWRRNAPSAGGRARSSRRFGSFTRPVTAILITSSNIGAPRTNRADTKSLPALVSLFYRPKSARTSTRTHTRRGGKMIVAHRAACVGARPTLMLPKQCIWRRGPGDSLGLPGSLHPGWLDHCSSDIPPTQRPTSCPSTARVQQASLSFFLSVFEHLDEGHFLEHYNKAILAAFMFCLCSGGSSNAR